MERIGEIIKGSFGYYTFPFSGEPFKGRVIEMTPEDCQIYFNIEGSGDEQRFRERLEGMDKWFLNKPAKIQNNWRTYVGQWLRKK